MKKTVSFIVMMLMAMGTFAKDIKTVVVTTNPQMHCEKCEQKIKGNLRFEKGVKKIETSVPDQTVTITYDADKTTVENLIKGFAKFGYEARPLKEGEKVQKAEGEECTM